MFLSQNCWHSLNYKPVQCCIELYISINLRKGAQPGTGTPTPLKKLLNKKVSQLIPINRWLETHTHTHTHTHTQREREREREREGDYRAHSESRPLSLDCAIMVRPRNLILRENANNTPTNVNNGRRNTIYHYHVSNMYRKWIIFSRLKG